VFDRVLFDSGNTKSAAQVALYVEQPVVERKACGLKPVGNTMFDGEMVQPKYLHKSALKHYLRQCGVTNA
jgi:hypothetical protein